MTQSVERTPILKSLSTFPDQIGNWKRISSTDFSDDVIEMLGVDEYINLYYVNGKGDNLNLYISYFEALGVTGVYHSPLNCMPGGGIKILDVDTIKLDSNQKKIKRLKLIQNGKKSTTYYWYYNRGRVIHSEYLDKIYLVFDAITKQRRDGAFIRIISYSKNENKLNSKEVLQFLNEVNRLSTLYLPGETIQ